MSPIGSQSASGSLAHASLSAPHASLSVPFLLGQSFWDWLLGLSRMSAGEGDLSIGWQYPLPAWGWALILLGAAALAGWSYHRLIGPRWARLGLAALRALVLLFLVMLLAGPMLVREDQQVEPDRLLMLVDRSASMQVKDLTGEGGEPRSRDAGLRAALERQADLFNEPAMTEQRRVRWFGFGGETFEMAGPGPGRGGPGSGGASSEAGGGEAGGVEAAGFGGGVDGLGGLPAADRSATRLRTAIEQSTARAAGHPVAGVVLLSDGRSPQPTGPDLVSQLNQRGIPVFAVPLGSETLPMDLALSEVQAPERAFADDIVPVSLTVEQIGGVEADLPAAMTVRLIDSATSEVVDRRRISPEQLGQSLRLTARSDTPGTRRYRIEVQPGDAEAPDNQADFRELNTDNNTRTIAVEVIDRPLRVLYVEGYPRWEYRFLKNLLIREQSIESSTMLLSAGPEFAQEGDVPINRLPRNGEEMRRYDLLIVGDLPAGTFSDRQKALIRDHVSAGGAGVLWIGGRRYMPGDFAGGPLGELLPLSRPASVSRFGGPNASITMQPTPLARRLSVLRLQAAGAEPTENGAAGGAANGSSGQAAAWPQSLRPLRWVQQIGPLKPAAEVLATAAQATVNGRPLPLVVRMRYGAGQSLYLASDEIWRWRYGRGEVYYQQFWIQLLRMLARGRIQQMGSPAQLDAAHRRIDLGQTTVVTLRVSDPAIAEQGLSSVELAVTPTDEAGGQPIDTLTLREQPREGETDAGPTLYRATWQPGAAGRLLLNVTEPALSGYDLTETLDVAAPGDERAHPQTDHPRLRELAQATGGAVIPLDELGQLKTKAANLAEITPRDQSEPIWHSPLALILALLLLTGEWIGRKVIRLV